MTPITNTTKKQSKPITALVRDFLGREGATETLAQRVILQNYASRANHKKGYTFNPGRELIKSDCGISDATITRANAYFKQLGVLDWKKGFGNQHGVSASNLYQLKVERLLELSAIAQNEYKQQSATAHLEGAIAHSENATAHSEGATAHQNDASPDESMTSLPKNKLYKSKPYKSKHEEQAPAQNKNADLCLDGSSGSLFDDSIKEPLVTAETIHPANFSTNEGNSESSPYSEDQFRKVFSLIEGQFGTKRAKAYADTVRDCLDDDMSAEATMQFVEDFEEHRQRQKEIQLELKRGEIQFLPDQSCEVGPGYLNDYVFRCFNKRTEEFGTRRKLNDTRSLEVVTAELRDELDREHAEWAAAFESNPKETGSHAK